MSLSSLSAYYSFKTYQLVSSFGPQTTVLCFTKPPSPYCGPRSPLSPRLLTLPDRCFVPYALSPHSALAPAPPTPSYMLPSPPRMPWHCPSCVLVVSPAGTFLPWRALWLTPFLLYVSPQTSLSTATAHKHAATHLSSLFLPLYFPLEV